MGDAGDAGKASLLRAAHPVDGGLGRGDRHVVHLRSGVQILIRRGAGPQRRVVVAADNAALAIAAHGIDYGIRLSDGVQVVAEIGLVPIRRVVFFLGRVSEITTLPAPGAGHDERPGYPGDRRAEIRGIIRASPEARVSNSPDLVVTRLPGVGNGKKLGICRSVGMEIAEAVSRTGPDGGVGLAVEVGIAGLLCAGGSIGKGLGRAIGVEIDDGPRLSVQRGQR